MEQGHITKSASYGRLFYMDVDGSSDCLVGQLHQGEKELDVTFNGKGIYYDNGNIRAEGIWENTNAEPTTAEEILTFQEESAES